MLVHYFKKSRRHLGCCREWTARLIVSRTGLRAGRDGCYPGIASPLLLNFSLAWNEAFLARICLRSPAAPLTVSSGFLFSHPEGLVLGLKHSLRFPPARDRSQFSCSAGSVKSKLVRGPGPSAPSNSITQRPNHGPDLTAEGVRSHSAGHILKGLPGASISEDGRVRCLRGTVRGAGKNHASALIARTRGCDRCHILIDGAKRGRTSAVPHAVCRCFPVLCAPKFRTCTCAEGNLRLSGLKMAGLPTRGNRRSKNQRRAATSIPHPLCSIAATGPGLRRTAQRVRDRAGHRAASRSVSLSFPCLSVAQLVESRRPALRVQIGSGSHQASAAIGDHRGLCEGSDQVDAMTMPTRSWC